MSYGDEAPPWEGQTGGFQKDKQGRGGRRPRGDRADGPSDDYVEVKHRILEFYRLHPGGSIQTELLAEFSDLRVEHVPTMKTRGSGDDRRQVEMLVPRAMGVITVQARAYRTPEDPRPAIGHSYLLMPGQTPYTDGSELENAETSAVGRALAMAGIAVNKGISSGNEIRTKRQGHDDETEAAEAYAKWQAEQKTSQPAVAPAENPATPAAAPDTTAAPDGALRSSQVPPEQSEQAAPAPAVDEATGEILDGKPAGLTAQELAGKMKEYNVGSVVVVAKAKARFGHSNIRSLTDEDRGFLWADCAADLTG